jgi:hypothetical protein
MRIEVKAMAATPATRQVSEKGEVQIRAGSVLLTGELKVPEDATGIVLLGLSVCQLS